MRVSDAAPHPTRFHLAPEADRLSGHLLIDTEEHPEADLVTLSTALWVSGALRGPAFLQVLVTTEYELVAAVTLADGTTIHSGAHDFQDMTGVETSERTHADVLAALRALIDALNVQLDALDAYGAARFDELTFAQIAVGFHDPTMVEHASLHLVASPILIDGRTLLAMLDVVDDARPDLDDLNDGAAALLLDPDPAPFTFEAVVAYVAALDDDEPDDDGIALLHRAATALGITTTLIDQFDEEADLSPSLVLETIGYLLNVATAAQLLNTDEIVVVFGAAGNGRTFRIGGTVQASSARVNLMSPPLPTTLLSGPSAPTVPWRMLTAVEVALGGLNGAAEEHCDVLVEHFTVAEFDARNSQAA